MKFTKEALVISTGEIFEVNFIYKSMKFTFELPEELKSVNSKDTTIENYVKYSSDGSISATSPDKEMTEKKEPYYVLSNGNKYSEKELIVGLDNIREYRIKNIIE
jgi:hypothetical protein